MNLAKLQDTRSFLCAWDSPDKNTGVGCQFLQGISPAQVSCIAGRLFITFKAQLSPLQCQRPGFNHSLNREDPLEEGMASSIPARRILWTEEPGRLQSTGCQPSLMDLRHTRPASPPQLWIPAQTRALMLTAGTVHQADVRVVVCDCGCGVDSEATSRSLWGHQPT